MDSISATATPYEREFPNVATNDSILVGAYWYPWYGAAGRHWSDGYRGTPVLGEYSSSDATVINRQIDWATGHGVDFFAASWWGWASYEDEVLHSHFLMADLADEIDFAILYESTGRLTVRDGLINMDDAANRRVLADDMRTLAQTYFIQPGYLRLEGRPVVFLYLTRIFVGDVAGALAQARAAAAEGTGVEPFLIGDEVYWQPPNRARFEGLDGLTAYNMHTSVPDVADGFAEDVLRQYRPWSDAAAAAGLAFVPSVIPGFDDTAVRPEAGHPIIPRSPALFGEQLQDALDLAVGQPPMVMITSWNEWHEDTSIEPAEEYGLDYLEVLRDVLGGR